MSALVRRGFGAALALAVSFAAAPAYAQYFGGNKVQYRTFKFEVLKTLHFDIYYYPEEKESIAEAGRMAERAYLQLSKVLDHRFDTRQPIILYASQPHFQQTNAIGGYLGEGTGGVTEALKRRVVMPSAGPLAETDHVLAHELVHAFQYDITSRGVSASGGLPGVLRLPLWFVEGMAEYLSVGPRDPHTAMWIRDAIREEKLPTVKQLNNPKFFPYRFGQAFWAYVAGRYGDAVVGRMLRAAARAGDPEVAIKEVLGISHEQLSKDWHAALKASYKEVLDAKKAPSTAGQAIITEKQAGELNIAPALSPDGKSVVFLSEKDLFSVDLFLADAETGKVRRKLTSTATDPHFESLQFIQSAGSWSPTGDRFALGTISKGNALLSIIDPENGEILKEVELPKVDEIYDPTWSPDGKRVAFAAIDGGALDLHITDLDSGQTKQVTNDLFGDLQPSWSPDGKHIAFMTDRFSTKLYDLEYGGYRIALYDVATGEVRPGPSFANSKNINPQWAPDSQSIYFISDHNGISNIYRAALPRGPIEQLTDVSTGISGITSLSASLTVARNSGKVMFSGREDQKYKLYALRADRPVVAVAAAEGESVPAPVSTAAAPAADTPTTAASRALTPDPARLPPFQRRQQQVYSGQEDPAPQLSPGTTQEEPYKPKMTLSNVGQGTTIAAGVDRFGTAVAGGTSLYFSDMLGNKNLGIDVYAQAGSFSDIGARVAYGDFSRRQNWIVGIERIPYITGGAYQVVRGTENGQPVLLEQTFLERQTSTAVFGVAAHPFNRAQRLEFGASARRLDLTREIRTNTFDLGGNFLGRDTEKLPGSGHLNLSEVSTAFVHDTSVFAATSPIVGRRFRLEVAQTMGSIDFTGALADYRRYFMPLKPYTFAFRVLHYGRYGRGGEDQRITPLFLGYPTLVRGYDSDTFRGGECVPDETSTCPIFDRLIGSRMLVGNVELRFPPFGAATGQLRYGPVPFELAFFADAGVAWTRASGDTPTFFGGDRKGVYSVGVAGRLNLFGLAVLELDYTRPLSRPGRGWVWQFHISPGGY